MGEPPHGAWRSAGVPCSASTPGPRCPSWRKLTSEDFQWLVDTEPAVRARLATILAERLQQR
jgi:hypothetical protein